jgi:hypothetical protein
MIPEEKKLRQHLQMLLDVVTVQQAENSMSQRRETRAPAPERSVHDRSSRPSGQPGRVESIRSPANHRVEPSRGARGASSVRRRTMTSGGSGG